MWGTRKWCVDTVLIDSDDKLKEPTTVHQLYFIDEELHKCIDAAEDKNPYIELNQQMPACGSGGGKGQGQGTELKYIDVFPK